MWFYRFYQNFALLSCKLRFYFYGNICRRWVQNRIMSWKKSVAGFILFESWNGKSYSKHLHLPIDLARSKWKLKRVAKIYLVLISNCTISFLAKIVDFRFHFSPSSFSRVLHAQKLQGASSRTYGERKLKKREKLCKVRKK